MSVVVRQPAVDGPEGRQQPAPGVVPALEHLLAVLVGRLPQLLADRGDGVVLVVEVALQESSSRSSAQNRNTSRIMTVRAAS